jgi:hypothetical protein
MLKIELTLQEIQVIVQALHEIPLPYKFSAPLLQKIEDQVKPQLAPKGEEDGNAPD